MQTCPKCGYTRTDADADKAEDQCPACGVYYAKALKAKESLDALMKKKAAQAAKANPEPVSNSTGAFAAASKPPVKEKVATSIPDQQAKNVRTTTCKDCSGLVSKSAKTCPHCGAKMPAEPNNELGMGTAFITFAILGVVIYGMANKTPNTPTPSRPSSPATTAEIHGYSACKEQVRNRLKSPSTADFPWGPTRMLDLGGNQFMVISHVDAQNGFGAVIRTNFSCKVTVKPETKEYSIDQVNFDN